MELEMKWCSPVFSVLPHLAGLAETRYPAALVCAAADQKQ
jgi:hypothetical protein